MSGAAQTATAPDGARTAAQGERPAGPVLVTGGSGFLGVHLCRELRGAGVAVRALCRGDAPELRELGVSLSHGDLSADGGGDAARGDATTGRKGDDPLVEALRGCAAVYHLAGLVSRDPDKGQQMMRLHVDGTRRLLQAAAAAGVRRVLLASTSGTVAVSAEPEPVPDETFPYALDLCAGWPYYLSKIYQEKLALDLGAKLGLEVVVVNPSLLLGPGDRRGSSTLDVRKLLCGEVPLIPPGGLSFVDVRDVARTCLVAMERGRPGARYLLGGPNWTFREFFGRLCRMAKIEGPWLRLPSRWNSAVARLSGVVEQAYRHRGHDAPLDRISVEMSQHFWYCDSSLARAELGFDPRDPGETLDDTVRDLRATLRLGR
jgi:dihydroflavonol-4-reductase